MVAVGSPDRSPHLAGLEVGTLRGARLPDGTTADVAWCAGGATLDAAGWLALPAGVEPHAHLDKALTASRLAPGPSGPSGPSGHDLRAAVDAWRALSPSCDRADVAARALEAVRRYVARGITAVRTHVNVAAEGDRMRAVDALVDLRERLRGRVALQVCLLAGPDTPDAAIDDAVARGIDVLGGCPHLAPDPHHEVTRVLDAAERTGLPVDLHADERTDLPDDMKQLDVVDLAEQVIARGLTQRVTASHAVRLGSLPPDEIGAVAELLARAGVGVVTLPITNLYLQGRDATHLAPRGLTALRPLLDAGVVLAAGGDNLRDPFNPVGRADPLETTSLLVTAGHLRPDEALDAVTTSARTVLGLPPDGDLLLVPDTGHDPLGEAIAGSPDARIVLHRGRVVADTRSARRLDPALAPTPERL